MIQEEKNRLSELLLQLSLIVDIGPSTIQNLLEKIGADEFINLHQFKATDFLAVGLSSHRANQLVLGLQDYTKLDQELKLIAKHNVHWTTVVDQNYPAKLKHTQGAPPILYWKGDMLDFAVRSLAIVGSRQANQYGKKVIDEIVPALVSSGYAIVSGGALGADTMAHQATLAAGGMTIVVCGTGLVHSYPSANMRLFEQVAKNGGAIVSSFAMNTAGLPSNFPARNRIISGLSDGCVVVQAAIQSGAKITAHLALDQGREVFVVPGLFGDPLSAGCHSLAQQGAKVIHNVEDILSEFNNKTYNLYPITPKRESVVSNINKIALNSNDLLVNLCSNPISFDELQVQLSLQRDVLQERLFELQLQGQVKQNFAGLWEKG